MIDKALLARIRKCLALARSDNEHEAAAALAKARALMAEHGITEATLALAEVEEATARASRTQRPALWENYLAAAVDRAFGTMNFLNGDRDRQFVGRGASPIIASYAFGVLFRQLKRARADYIDSRLRRCKPGRKRQRADIFCEGWAHGVVAKIIALVPKRPVDAAVEAYLQVQYPDLVPVGQREAKISGGGASNDWWNGAAAGRKAELHTGVDSNAGPALLS